MEPVPAQDPEASADVTEVTKVAEDGDGMTKADSTVSVNAVSNDETTEAIEAPAAHNPSMDLTSRLEDLLKDDADLRLWLQHTGYFNLPNRERVLDGIRKLVAVEEERQKLLHELQGSAGGLFQAPSAASPTLLAPAISLPIATPVVLPCRPAQAAPPSFASMTSYSVTGSVHGDSSARSEDRVAVGEPRVSLTKTKSRASARSRRMSSSSGVVEGTRFFLVKSYNSANVYMSQRDGLWVTQIKNSGILTKAFKECKEVYIFFSINKSHCFQGYARMTSTPDESIIKPAWIEHITLSAASHPFRVEWINTRVTNFDDVGEIKNPYNEWRSVVVGRDGQEYPPAIGRKIMAILDGTETQDQPPTAPVLRLTPRSRPGHHHRSDSTELEDELPTWRKKRAAYAASKVEPSPEPESDNLIDYW